MKKEKTNIFLTGATGVMGTATLNELMKYPDNYEVTVLARDSKRNRKKLDSYQKMGVKVVWGDLLDEESLSRGIETADIVLHIGGMVSPMAEYYPEKTLKVNVGSMRLIARIAKKIEGEQPDRTIKVVYIGSVSQYGSKLPPDHWGKTGDLLKSAKMDAYAVSKILAERELVEAGLKKWVSIRQTAILHPGLLKNANNPVTFHVPVNGVLEWITTEDSGRLMERICRPDVPDFFWNHFYNAGGGEPFRLTNMEFERGILKALGCPPPEKVFEANWFATDNFHGMWFEDSDYLDEILHFRQPDSYEAALGRMKSTLPGYYRLTPLAPAFIIKAVMKRVAKKPGLGPLWWLEHNDEERIRSAWGSREAYEMIPDWKQLKQINLSKKCEGVKYKNSPSQSVLKEKICSRGHSYATSEVLEEGGHSCPFCLFIDSKVESPKF